MKSYTVSELKAELALGVFAVIVDAPSGNFSSAIGMIEKLTGVVGITITQNIESSTHYLYLAEADYMDDAGLLVRSGSNSYSDVLEKLNKPLVIFYDDGNMGGSGVRLYSALLESGGRVLNAEVGNADWEDLGL